MLLCLLALTTLALVSAESRRRELEDKAQPLQ
jgi:hypothetical protein